MSSPGFQRFISDWCNQDSPPTPIEPSALEEAEQALGCVFPASYKAALLGNGLPHVSIKLLDAIVDLEADCPDVSEFLEPQAIVEISLDWREMGLLKHLVAFANDCSGNLFAFAADQSAPDDAVWFFDHDFDSVEQVAGSFDDWLMRYVEIHADSTR